MPDGLTVHHTVELAMRHCPNHVELSIFTSAELLSPSGLCCRKPCFCGIGPGRKSHPPTHLHSLPLSTDVPSWRAGAAEGGAVVRGGLPGCASLSRSADMAAQVGGVGVDVEADEVPLRAKGHPHEDGRLGVLWLRYVARGGSSVAT